MNMDRAGAEALMSGLAAWHDSALNSGQAVPEIIIFPSAVFFEIVAPHLKNGMTQGGQNCHHENSGAHTGDISAAMLKDAGCEWVLLGHSERRTNHQETSTLIAEKANLAISNELKTMICVGETLEERENGKAFEIVATQLKDSLPADFPANKFAIAYEPVWAIGTGKVASPADIQAMHEHIHNQLIALHPDYAAIKILYGGSVKPSNAAEILELPHVGGALVGGASLTVEDFTAIIASSK